MTSSRSDLRQQIPTGLRLALLLAAAIAGATSIGLIAARQPLYAVLGVIALFAALVVIVMPDLLTLGVIFILFSNAAVIAVRFHGVPLIIATGFPLLLSIPLANYLVFERQKIMISPVTGLMFLLGSVLVFSTLFSSYPQLAFDNLITYAAEGLGLYLLLTNTLRTTRMIRLAIWTLLLTGLFLGSLSLFQQATQTFHQNYGGFAQMSNAQFGTGVEVLQGEVLQPRLAGPLGDQNYYAQFMLMLVPIGLFRFWSEQSKILRVLALVATCVITAGVALTFSRGAAVGFVLMLAIIVFLRYIKLYQLAIIVLGIVAVLLLFPQYSTRLASLETIQGAVGSLASSDTGGADIRSADSSTQSRLTEMGTAALVFADHPLFGVGPGIFKYYYPEYADRIGIRVLASVRAAHNFYLGYLADTGALGLGSLLLIVILTLRSLARVRRDFQASQPDLSNMATGFLLAIATFLATGLFLSFAYERYFWLLIAVSNALVNIAVPPGKLTAQKISRRLSLPGRLPKNIKGESPF